MAKVLIEFKNVNKQFGNNIVYQDLSLQIMQGETLTILGGSGTGKSVLLKMLLGLLRPDAGEILFNGENIVDMPPASINQIRKRIGMLFQGAALFDSLNVFENIAYPIREHFKYEEEKIEAIVSQKLAMVGLPGKELIMPSDLSGGMKKRVGLARAIATDPEVILYDEPTTGLDPTNTKRIDKLILEMQKKLNVTSVAVTHDLESAFRFSNRLALVDNKKIEFVGSVEEFKECEHPSVKNFWRG